MAFQTISLEKEASDILSLIKGLRNCSTPAGRLPVDLLERIATMRASVGDLVSASHVCRHWRDSLTSSPRLWTEFQCKDVAPTLQHLARSDSVPINVIAGLRSDIQAVIALKSATERFGSLTLRLRPLDLLHVFRELATPASALQHLEVSVIPEVEDRGSFRPYIPATFLGGSTPVLKSLHLHEINSQLNFSEFPALTRLTLTTSVRVFEMSELFQLFTSARLLEEVSVEFSGPTTPILENRTVVRLPRMKKLSFSNTVGEFPKRLLFFLDIPCVEEVKLYISLPGEDMRTMRDFLPPQLHLLKVDNWELDLPYGRCKVQFSGPRGVVSIHALRGGNRGQDGGFQSHWLGSFEPLSTADVKNLTLRNYCPRESFDQSPVLALFRTMDGVRFLTIERCKDNIATEALSPPKKGSILFPHLQTLTVRPATDSTTVSPHLTDMARARDQAGFPLTTVSSQQHTTPRRRDADPFHRHLSCVQLNKRASYRSSEPVDAASQNIAMVSISFL